MLFSVISLFSNSTFICRFTIMVNSSGSLIILKELGTEKGKQSLCISLMESLVILEFFKIDKLQSTPYLQKKLEIWFASRVLVNK